MPRSRSISTALIVAIAASSNPSISFAAPPSEVARCDMFFKGVVSGSIEATPENQATASRCQSVLSGSANGPSSHGAGAASCSGDACSRLGTGSARSTDTKDLPPVEVQGERQTKPDFGQAAGVAGKGCGIGGLIGALAGVDPTVGCAVGGAIGFGWSYRKQIRDAREVEAAAKDAGMQATVSTEERINEKGKREEQLGALTIPYQAADMQTISQNTAQMLDRLAAMLAKSKNVLTVQFEGGEACEIPLAELQRRGALSRHTVLNDCGKSDAHRLVVSPMPDVQ